MQHISSSRKSAQVLWRERHYAQYFRHGGHRSEKAPSPDAAQLREAVQRAYGDEEAERVTLA